MQLISPHDETVVGHVTESSTEDVARACAKARAAQPSWAARSVEERVAVIEQFCTLLERDTKKAAQAMSRDMGKPVHQAVGEVGATIKRVRWFCAHVADVLKKEVRVDDGSMHEAITYEPLGVVGNISAWNFPYFVSSNVVIPALLCGNAVVFKPSEYATTCCQLFAELLIEAGVPAPALQTLVGGGAVGQALCAQELDGLYFTGSVPTGRAIASSMAPQLARVGLELGGKDPAYICEDVNVEAAVAAVGDGAFYNGGQSCCAVERIYVHRDIYDDFVTHLAAFARSIKVGHPEDAESYLGPLARAEACAHLDAQVADARKKGARIIVEGGRPADRPGYYYAPSVIADATHDMDVMCEESFGPIIGVMAVKDDEEAITLMNDTRFGLTASVHGGTRERAEGLLARVKAGTVYWNCCDRVSPHVPWTGWGESGLGSTLSTLGIQAFVQPKSWQLRKS